jgi:hypothetical protein
VKWDRIHTAFVLSLLAHGMLASLPSIQKEGDAGLGNSSTPLYVRLNEAPDPEPEKAQPPAQRQPEPVPAPKPRPEPVRKAPPRLAQVHPVEQAIEKPAEREQRVAETRFDMLAMINAQRERRNAVEQSVRQYEEAHSGAQIQGAADPSLANLQRNLQSLGSRGENTGGVFTILSKGTRYGEFAFNGWQPELGRRWREVIEVDAGPGGDLELAIVRRMIQLIRTHYSGDFLWRSFRLDKQLVLSARPEDTAALEEFLTREFFGTPTLAKRPASKAAR